MEDYNKVIVVDFDDTLCIHQTVEKSDIMQGMPNMKLINKLNKLYSDGYKILIYTARGHISCKNRAEADNKYRPIIKTWLRRYDVKFTTLSFDKPMAYLYIDDKAITPEEFISRRGI